MKKSNLKKMKQSHTNTLMDQMSPNVLRAHSLAQQTFNFQLQQQSTRIKQKETIISAQKTMKNLRGRHTSINYKKQFDFNQKWQGQNDDENNIAYMEYLKHQNQHIKYLKYINIALYLIQYWLISIYRIFQLPCYINALIPLIVISQFLDILIKKKGSNNYNIKNNQDHKNQNFFLQHFKMHWNNIILCVYLILIIIEYNTKSQQLHIFMAIIDLIVAIICYICFFQLYSGIKIEILSSKYRNQFYLVQLFGKCANIVHMSSIALILSSFVNKQVNWTLTIANFGQSWYAKYIYSIYFSCTTVFTIGYGDLAPKNLLQIVVILIIQAVGVINLGYIFSEIGRILAKINEDEQNLMKNIYQTQKIAQNYRLPDNLSRKMKEQIINHDLVDQKLNTHQQQKVLRMLDDDLRQNIIFVNKLHIVKHSIFFICNWSTKFIRKVADQLVMQTFRPDQPINQIRGHQKLYILSLGKLQIVPCSLNKSHQVTYRPIRIIQAKSKDQVQLNSYGYSSLISGLSIKLKAIAKDYSICYYVTKENFINIINENQKDFQYYHEIKSRIQTSNTKQVFQAPKLGDRKLHYNPNIYYLIKKYKKKMVKTQSRKFKSRRQYKSNFIIQDSSSTSKKLVSKELTQADIEVIQRNTVLSVEERNSRYNQILYNKKPLISLRNYKSKPNSIKQMTTLQKQIQKEVVTKDKDLNNFDNGKNYNSYFIKFNQKNRILDYNHLFCKNNKQSQKITSLSTMKYPTSKNVQYKILQNHSINQAIIDKILSMKIIEKP